jgi:hypothetical protein
MLRADAFQAKSLGAFAVECRKLSCQNFLISHSGAFHGRFMRHPSQMAKYPTRKFTEGDDP